MRHLKGGHEEEEIIKYNGQSKVLTANELAVQLVKAHRPEE